MKELKTFVKRQLRGCEFMLNAGYKKEAIMVLIKATKNGKDGNLKVWG